MQKPEWAPVTEHGQPRTGKTKNSWSWRSTHPLLPPQNQMGTWSMVMEGPILLGFGVGNKMFPLGYLGALERSSRGREADLVHPQVPLMKSWSMHGRAQSPQSDEVV